MVIFDNEPPRILHNVDLLLEWVMNKIRLASMLQSDGSRATQSTFELAAVRRLGVTQIAYGRWCRLCFDLTELYGQAAFYVALA